MEEAKGRIVFPFTAIVGQERAKLALLSCAVNPTIGGVLLSGDKGTGKSTLVRGLADILPEIEVVADCQFNCNPYNRLEMCDICYSKLRSEKLKVTRRKMRVVDLPLSITVDRLVGTLDIKRALKEGIRALQPGLLAEANRNILYIDEVNLLDDYVADVLLDSAAMGWNIIEREGVSVRHPARFILIGSMNPEEGELRPQILDRFGLYVKIEASSDPNDRMEIVRRVEEFQKDPISFYEKYKAKQERLRSSIIKAKELISTVDIDEELLKLLANTVVEMGIKTHRAEIITVRTAKAIAALDERKKVNLEDLKKAMELTLPHRLKAKPFDRIKRPSFPSKDERNEGENGRGRSEGEVRDGGGRQDRDRPFFKGNDRKVFKPDDVELEVKSGRDDLNLDVRVPQSRGSRNAEAISIGRPQGLPISYIPPFSEEQLLDIDLTATINTATLKLKRAPLEIDEDDIRVRVRRTRVPRLTVMILDSSGSMAVMRRIGLAKGITLENIKHLYTKRDYMSLIIFRGGKAEVAVPPTKRYDLILEALYSVPTGGRTPLPSALQAFLSVAKGFKMKNKNSIIKGILITDGKANVPLRKDVKEDVMKLAEEIKKRGIELVIYDTKPPSVVDPAPSYISLLGETADAHIIKV